MCLLYNALSLRARWGGLEKSGEPKTTRKNSSYLHNTKKFFLMISPFEYCCAYWPHRSGKRVLWSSVFFRKRRRQSRWKPSTREWERAAISSMCIMSNICIIFLRCIFCLLLGRDRQTEREDDFFGCSTTTTTTTNRQSTIIQNGGGERELFFSSFEPVSVLIGKVSFFITHPIDAHVQTHTIWWLVGSLVGWNFYVNYE